MLSFAGLSGPITRETAELFSEALPRAEAALVAALRKDDDA